jgi:hypothetical protein
MDKTPLVNGDIEIEGTVVSALSRTKIPVSAVDWNWEPDLEESQLIVVTSLVDTRGIRETYARIFKALTVAGVYKSVPVRKLFVKSPGDPIARKLIEELKQTNEGSIHIVRNTTANGAPRYSIVFTPYVGSGGPIPSKGVKDNAELRDFLEKRLGIDLYAVDRALAELTKRHNATIFNVGLSLRRAKKLNLAA